jgi:hypothetical protein
MQAENVVELKECPNTITMAPTSSLPLFKVVDF